MVNCYTLGCILITVLFVSDCPTVWFCLVCMLTLIFVVESLWMLSNVGAHFVPDAVAVCWVSKEILPMIFIVPIFLYLLFLVAPAFYNNARILWVLIIRQRLGYDDHLEDLSAVFCHMAGFHLHWLHLDLSWANIFRLFVTNIAVLCLQ